MLKLVLLFVLAFAAAHALMTLHISQETQEFMESYANSYHYGDPTTGCMIDEVPIRVQGVRGGMCTAHCSPAGACPSDKPTNCEAVPRCALENRATGEKFCALMCSQGMTCGQGASCKVIQGSLGICTYDDVYQALREAGKDD